MSSNAETRGDAERALRHIGDGLPDCWVPIVRQLAEAIIAEHPADDDEPVTEEWLRYVGFRDGQCGMLSRGVVHADLHAFKTFSHVTHISVYVGKGMATHTTVEKATRRQVRDLCRALGVDLRESSAAGDAAGTGEESE